MNLRLLEVDELIEYIDHELALIELSKLDPATRAEVAEYARHKHYDDRHGPNKRPGIWACCIYPTDPRK